MSNLTTLVQQSGLEESESSLLVTNFSSFEDVAKEWEVKAKTIVVTSRDQTTEMEMAKSARKKFSQMRIDVEKARKALKEQALRKGQAIDAIAKYLQSLIAPIETYLKEQEEFIKRDDARILAEAKAKQEAEAEKARIAQEQKEAMYKERVMALLPYKRFFEDVYTLITIDTSDDEYAKVLLDLQRKQNAYEDEQEAIRVENARLKKEADEKERARIETERKQKEEADRKQKEHDDELRKQREEQEAILQKERDEKEKLQKEADEKARLDAEKAQKEADEKARIEEEAKKTQESARYQQWLTDNAYDANSMMLHTMDNGDICMLRVISIYKKNI